MLSETPFSEDTTYTSGKATPDCSCYFQSEFYIGTIIISGTPFPKYIKYIFGKAVLDLKKLLPEWSFCMQKMLFLLLERFF